MPTLVMLHGMTGTAAMMHDFAQSILPENWSLITPQASFPHPQRGFTWWRYENEDEPGRRSLTATELIDVDTSLLKLVESMPDDDLVLGGFSQGGAMAMEMLQFPLGSRVKGIIAIATRVVRPMELRMCLQEIPVRDLLWMHGEKDHRVRFEAGKEILSIFDSSGWTSLKISHSKGHMIPIEFHKQIQKWLEGLV